MVRSSSIPLSRAGSKPCKLMNQEREGKWQRQDGGVSRRRSERWKGREGMGMEGEGMEMVKGR